MKKIVLAMLALLALTNVALAQSTDSKLLDKLVEKKVLTIEEANEIRKDEVGKEKEGRSLADVLQARKDGEAITLSNMMGFKTPLVQFGGYGQFLYDYNNGRTNHNQFKPRNVYLTINGTINPKFRYGIMLEFVNPTAVEYWGEWTACTGFNLKAGQFNVPITLENPISGAAIETIHYSRVVSNLFGMSRGDDVMLKQNGKNNLGRDIGVQASGELVNIGDHKLIDYKVGVFQGSGMNSNDLNNNKDFAGMLMLQPVKGLQVGGGAYFGEATYYRPGELQITEHVRNRWIASAQYTHNKFYLRGEYIKGKDARDDKEGAYGLAVYKLKPSVLNILAKAEYYMVDRASGASESKAKAYDYTAGVNYFFFNQCRLQLNYTYSKFNNNWKKAETNSKDEHTLGAQLQIVF